MRVIPGADDRETAAQTFRRLYRDTTLSFDDPVLRMLRSVVGLERVMFGTDHPYLRRDLAIGCLAALMGTKELTAAERMAVMGLNALTAFPRLADLKKQASYCVPLIWLCGSSLRPEFSATVTRWNLGLLFSIETSARAGSNGRLEVGADTKRQVGIPGGDMLIRRSQLVDVVTHLAHRRVELRASRLRPMSAYDGRDLGSPF